MLNEGIHLILLEWISSHDNSTSFTKTKINASMMLQLLSEQATQGPDSNIIVTLP